MRAWTMRGSVPDGATQHNRVLPDGCMDVIFNLSSNGDVLPDEQRAFVVGTMTRAEVYITLRRVDFLGKASTGDLRCVYLPSS